MAPPVPVFDTHFTEGESTQQTRCLKRCEMMNGALQAAWRKEYQNTYFQVFLTVMLPLLPFGSTQTAGTNFHTWTNRQRFQQELELEISIGMSCGWLGFSPFKKVLIKTQNKIARISWNQSVWGFLPEMGKKNLLASGHFHYKDLMLQSEGIKQNILGKSCLDTETSPVFNCPSP